MSKSNKSEFLLFKAENKNNSVDVRFEDESVWLSQEQMTQLFDKGRSTITENIKNIFHENELDEKVVCRSFRHTTQDEAIQEKSQLC